MRHFFSSSYSSFSNLRFSASSLSLFISSETPNCLRCATAMPVWLRHYCRSLKLPAAFRPPKLIFLFPHSASPRLCASFSSFSHSRRFAFIRGLVSSSIGPLGTKVPAQEKSLLHSILFQRFSFSAFQLLPTHGLHHRHCQLQLWPFHRRMPRKKV